jgi:hypothetical protein
MSNDYYRRREGLTETKAMILKLVGLAFMLVMGLVTLVFACTLHG